MTASLRQQRVRDRNYGRQRHFNDCISRKTLRYTMSLDIAVLDDEGAPAHEVSVPADAHSLLMRQADFLQLSQFSRLHDYYEDVDYTAQETQILQREADALADGCSSRPELCTLIRQIQDLAHFAVNNNKAIVAIAD